MARKKTPPEYGESPWCEVSGAVVVVVVAVDVATAAFSHPGRPTKRSKTYRTHDGGLPVEL